MNKKDLVNQISSQTRLSKVELEKILAAVFELIQKNVALGEDVTLSGFGTFSLSKRKERNGYNPHTGKPIRVPEVLLPKFKAGKDFRLAIERNKST